MCKEMKSCMHGYCLIQAWPTTRMPQVHGSGKTILASECTFWKVTRGAKPAAAAPSSQMTAPETAPWRALLCPDWLTPPVAYNERAEAQACCEVGAECVQPTQIQFFCVYLYVCLFLLQSLTPVSFSGASCAGHGTFLFPGSRSMGSFKLF